MSASARSTSAFEYRPVRALRAARLREFLDAGPDVAGEVAAARAGGPGSFRVQLRDALDEAARTAK